MGVHRLSVHKYGRQTRSIKARKQPVYYDYKVKLFVTALEFGFLSCKAVIQICIIALDLTNSEGSAEHSVIIIKRFLHLRHVQICAFIIFIIRNRVCDRKFREIWQYSPCFFADRDRGFPIYNSFQEIIIRLRPLDRINGQYRFIGLSSAMLKAEFLLRLIYDGIKDFQHMCFCLINGQVLVAVIVFQLLCAEMLGLEA